MLLEAFKADIRLTLPRRLRFHLEQSCYDGVATLAREYLGLAIGRFALATD